jgi:hypothetical protein
MLVLVKESFSASRCQGSTCDQNDPNAQCAGVVTTNYYEIQTKCEGKGYMDTSTLVWSATPKEHTRYTCDGTSYDKFTYDGADTTCTGIPVSKETQETIGDGRCYPSCCDYMTRKCTCGIKTARQCAMMTCTKTTTYVMPNDAKSVPYLGEWHNTTKITSCTPATPAKISGGAMDGSVPWVLLFAALVAPMVR